MGIRPRDRRHRDRRVRGRESRKRCRYGEFHGDGGSETQDRPCIREGEQKNKLTTSGRRRALYALIQGARHAADRMPLPLIPRPQPPAALRCSEEDSIPAEHRVEEKAVRAVSQQKSSCPVPSSSPNRGNPWRHPAAGSPEELKSRGCSEIGSSRIVRKRRGRGDQYLIQPIRPGRVW